jgi:uroporphyrinogen-III synthase
VGEDPAGGLRGKRVVVTRTFDQSRELVRALEEKGAVPVVLPMVAFAPPDNLAELDEALGQMSRFDWVFVTSQNALRALQERGQAIHADIGAVLGRVRVAAVGPATAEALKSAGIELAYNATKHLGVSLAQELATEVKGKTVLLPRSDRANPELVEQLKRLGATVQEVVAYKTVPPDDAAVGQARAALQQRVDAILFFSPSAFHHLQDILGSEKVLEISRQATFAAIGPVTEKALRAARVERVLCADDTTVASIVIALQKHFSAPRSGCSAGVNSA